MEGHPTILVDEEGVSRPSTGKLMYEALARVCEQNYNYTCTHVTHVLCSSTDLTKPLVLQGK